MLYAMLEMLVDLVTTRLERDPVPCGLLATLALVSPCTLSPLVNAHPTYAQFNDRIYFTLFILRITFVIVFDRHLMLTMIGIVKTEINSRKVVGMKR